MEPKTTSIRRRRSPSIRFCPLILTMLPGLSLADSETFECKITDAFAVSPQGEVVRNTSFLRGQVGTTFSVERLTGAIRGSKVVSNRGSKQVTVVNQAPGAEYMVFSNSTPKTIPQGWNPFFGMVSYLYVCGDMRAAGAASRSFIYTRSNYGYVGYCD